MKRAWVSIALLLFGCQRRGDVPRADLIVAAGLAAPIPSDVTVEELAPSILLHIDGVEGIILRKSEPATIREAVAFERGLAGAIGAARSKPHALDWVPSGLRSLKRIYFARVQDGQRIVGARLYCVDDADRTWTLTGMAMADGGECNVLAWYDPQTRVYRVKANMQPTALLPAPVTP